MAEEKPAAEGKKEEGKRKLAKGRHWSAIKRHRQSLKRHVRNQGAISALRTAMKKVRQAVSAKDKTQAEGALRGAMSLLHKAASRGVIHHRNAARHIARLSRLVSLP